MCKKLVCLVVVMALASVAQADVIFEDNFDHITFPTDSWDRVNYQGWYEDQLAWPNPGGDWNIGGWDGYQSLPDLDTGVSPTLAAYNHVETFNAGMGEEPFVPDEQSGHPGNAGGTANGVLRIISVGSFWEHAGNSGPFLYKEVVGDFVAEVEVVGQSHIFHNMGGLMARAANPDGVGENENWTQISYFPEWNQGNRINDTVMGATSFPAATGYPLQPYLRLSRSGSTFTYATSTDGVDWSVLGSVERQDLPDELQVGIFQANFAPDWIAPMDFDNFVLIPEPATIALLGLGGLALIRRKRS